MVMEALALDNSQSINETGGATPRGYKKTEVGLLPIDWRVCKLGELLAIPPTYGINAAAVPYNLRFPAYIRITDITEDGRFSEGSRASVDHPDSDKYLLEPGDIVLARTGASTGKSYRYRMSDGALVYAGFLIRVHADQKQLEPKFLQHWIHTSFYWSWVKTNSMRSGQPGINGKQYAELPLPIPPTLHEQQAIAEALSDADALIEGLERLIAKKRLIKQGAMQELLTGKRRLPGFEGKWEIRYLGEIADVDPENLAYNTPPEFSFNYISLEDVDHGSLVSYSEQKFMAAPSRARRRLRSKDILISTVRPNLLSHLLFSESHGDWVCSTGFSVLRCKQRVFRPDYVFEHLFSGEVLKQIETLITGSNYPAINTFEVRAIKIPCPDYSEQVAIASVLANMNAEIQSREAKLSKARQIKQGMMQELLTGRIRLV